MTHEFEIKGVWLLDITKSSLGRAGTSSLKIFNEELETVNAQNDLSKSATDAASLLV
jgi:hypothetical protein